MSALPGRRDSLGFIGFLALCLGVSALGAAATATSVGSWYRTLAKPAFNPPDWVFAPVWSALFFMMAFSAWRIWRRGGLRHARAEMALFALQLTLNLGWSLLFFGMRSIGAALVEILVLLLAIIATSAVFWRRDRVAGMLLLPYAAWVGFAAVLNAAIWRLN